MSLRKISKILVTLIAALAIILVAFYGSLPWLVARFGTDYLQQHWFDTAELEIGHPGWRGLDLRRVVLVSDAFELRTANARIDYHWPDLISGRLKSIQFDRLDVTVLPGDKAATEPADLSLGPLFAAVPFDTVQVDQLHLRVPELEFTAQGSASLHQDVLNFDLNGLTPTIASQFRVDGKLSQDGRLALRFDDQAAEGTDYLSLAGQVSEDTLELEGEVSMSGYAFALTSAVAGLPDGSGTVRGNLGLKVPWPISPELSLAAVTAQATQVQATWQSADELTGFDVAVSSAHLEQGRASATLAGKLVTRVEQYNLTLALPEDTRLQLDAGTLTGSPGLQLDVTHPESNLSASIGSFTLHSVPAPQLELNARITAQAAEARVAGDLTAQVNLADGAAPTDNAHGQITFEGEAAMGEVSHAAKIQATYQLTLPKLTTTGQASVSVLDDVRFSLTYDTQSGAGSLDLSDRLDLREPLAAALLPDYAEAYDLDGGTIDTTSTLSWKSLDTIAAEASLSLQDVAAHYEDYTISGISGRTELSTSDAADIKVWRLAPTTLRASQIDVGFLLEDTSVALSFSDGTLNIAQASARALGGQVTSAPFAYDPVTGDAELTLKITDLDLAEVLALEGEDVSGTGRLSGTVPVSIVANEPTVQNGAVHALPPGGVIQLSPALALPTGQPGLDFALSALQDFRYSQLEAAINYAANGDLKLGVSLRGSNPAVEKGRAIEYNVNISENLPILLRSLRLQDTVTERIERQVNK